MNILYFLAIIFFFFSPSGYADLQQAADYQVRAADYEKQGELDKALDVYNKYLEENPDDADGYFNRGKILFKQEKFDEALEDFHKAIELNPNNEDFYYQRALTYNKLKKGVWAIVDLSKVISLDPKRYDACQLRAQLNLRRGDLDDATNDLNKLTDEGVVVDPLLVADASEAKKKQQQQRAAQEAQQGWEQYQRQYGQPYLKQ